MIGAGGMPIALAVLAHPAASAAIFASVTHVRMTSPPRWLTAAARLWLAPAAVWLGRLANERNREQVVRASALAAAGVLLPPLTSFAIYFVCVHAPAHVGSLIADPTLALRITDAASAARLSVSVTTLTLLLGAMLWPFTPGGEPTRRLLGLTIHGLAALTLPHMLFERWLHLEAPRDLSLP